jgi:hypothetical protein
MSAQGKVNRVLSASLQFFRTRVAFGSLGAMSWGPGVGRLGCRCIVDGMEEAAAHTRQ